MFTTAFVATSIDDTVRGMKLRFNIPDASGGILTLPLGPDGSYSHSFTVEWGDGERGFVTSYNDPDRIHTYAGSGNYDVRINGLCEYLSFGATSAATQLTHVLSLNNNIGIKVLNFQGCTNLTYLDSTMNRLGGLTTALNMFRDCSAISTIPSGLFYNSPGVVTFQGFCRNSSIASIPADLFSNSPNVTSVEGAWRACSSLASIPQGLFDGAPSVTNFLDVFSGCSSVTSIPDGLFDNQTSATDFGSAFNTTSIASIPSGLFDNNTLADSFYATFLSSSVTSIPDGLFDNNTNATDFESTFAFCSSLTSIPSGLFDNNTNATNFKQTFWTCTSIDSIPSGIFDNNTLVTNVNGCFRGLPITTVDDNIFVYNTGIANYGSTFWQCSSLTGVPWSGIIMNAEAQPVPPSVTDNCFLACTAMSGYDDIPAAWL